MHVIVVAQQKGGAGKSMLAANLAAIWAPGRRVGLLDIDPQHSLSRWHRLRPATLPALAFSEVTGWRLAGEMDRLTASCDLVIVDTPPQIDAEARRAVRIAQLVLIPLQPSPPDLWAAEGTIRIAAEEKRGAAVGLNRAPAGGGLRTAVAAYIAQGGHALLAAVLGNRSAYAQAFARGMGVAEAWPKSAAADEIRALALEVESLIG